MSTVYSENISGSVAASSNISGSTETAQAAEGDKGIYSAPSRALALSVVAEHNVDTEAHNDIRLFLTELSNRVNAIADSDDTTLDQLSEVVAYIKSNRSLIESVTTAKVNVSDIIDNLTTNSINKPLSAAQGVALKQLIDAITIPSALPNPQSLKFTGATTGTYDGSKAVEINIPEPSSASAIERGSFQFVATKSTTTEYTHTFENSYEEAPSVYADLVWTGTGTEVANNLFATLLEVTKTGFTVRVYNNDSSNRTVGINWHAITDASNLIAGGTVTDEQIQNAVDKYLNENPVESPVESVNGKTGQVELTADDVNAVSADGLQSAINTALAQAKESGEFDGADGASGTSVSVESISESAEDEGGNVVTFSDGTKLTVKNGSKGSAGAAGQDGVSATHSWNGTILTVTSASGTSSADLKGDKGDKGDTGATGAAGYTPVKGTDYFTKEDKTEFLRNVTSEIGVISGTNLLHNADWAYSLVNQRRHSGAVADAYCIDRWIGNGAVTPAAGQYVTLTAGTTVTQRMEIIPESLIGKKCTFSIDVDGNAESKTIAFPAATVDAGNTVTLSNCTVELGFLAGTFTLCGVSCSYVPYIKISALADINVKRVFLELGNASHMTETPPPPYSSNLTTCQRYFYVCPDYTNAMGMWMNSTYFRIVTACPKMRVSAPTLIVTMADYYFNNVWNNLASATGLVGGLGVTISGTASSNSAGAAAISRVGYTANAELE